MARRVKIGDIVEIPTPEGVAYAQVTHIHPEYGPLLRVFPDTFEHRPPDVAAEFKGAQPRFSTFFPLQAALRQQILAVVDKPAGPRLTRTVHRFPRRDTGPGHRKGRKLVALGWGVGMGRGFADA